MKMHQKKDAKTIYNSSSQNLHYKTKTPARSNIINNKQGLRASGLSLLPLALRPGLLLAYEKSNIKRNTENTTESNAKSNAKSNIFSNIVFRNFILLAVVFIASLVIQISNTNNVSAASLTLTIPNSISLSISPENGATFKKSSPSTLSVKTDVNYGYTLSIKSKDSANNNLVNSSAKISSISFAMSESDFSSSAGNNTWGYLPSKLASIDNSNFQPGPTSEPTILDTTSSSTEGTNYSFTLGAKVDNTIPTGNYTNTFVLTAVSNEPPYDGIMQDWDGCESLPQETKTLNLLDTRDNKIYTVAKLKDGKCWMTKNLEIGKEDGETKLTSEDSDVASSFNLPASKTSGFSSSNVANVYVHPTYGGYYTWYAATAGEGTSNKSSGDTSHSICPKGWKLPSKSEYDTLVSKQGSAKMTQSPANFMLGGNYYNGSASNQGSGGYYWSSTAYTGNDAYRLNVYSSSADTSNSGGEYFGFSVRCVAREPEKKSYSITYQPGKDECNDDIEIGSSRLSNMPSPNPQTGSTTENSVKLSSNTINITKGGFGYYLTFKGWCTSKPTDSATCPGQTYMPGASYPLSDGTNNITLWAVWNEIESFEPPSTRCSESVKDV